MKTKYVKAILLFLFIYSTLSSTVKSQSISELLDGYYAYNRFIGSVLVVQSDKVLFQKSYGYANKDLKIKNDGNTIFDLGSVTKTMTAIAILKLHDEGKLSVFDRVDKYIPSFINDKTDSITIINLLNHTSGMAANLGRQDDTGSGLLPGSEPIEREQLIEKFKPTKLKYKPGTKHEYNNYGYTLLAYIIEKVSGLEYAKYLEMVIFRDLNLSNTAYKLDLTKQPATGYIGIGTTNLTPAKDPFHPSWIKGAGYMYSSTNDLSKYVEAVFSHKIFSEKTLRLMMDTCISTGKQKNSWALGWEKRKIDDLDWYSHGGGIFGFSTRISYLPEKGISIIILSNLTKDIKFDEIYSAKFSFIDEITEKTIKILNNKNVEYLPVPNGKANKQLIGNYKFDDSHFANISRLNDSLFFTTDTNNNFTLFDYSLNKDITDTIGNYSICKEFSKAISSANFEGFDKYASEKMKIGLFNAKGIAQINNIWKYYQSKGGEFLSYNIFNKTENSYSLAFHFEKAEITMKISFDNQNLIQGLFFLSVLPKCNIHKVNLVSAGNDEYVVDGYKYGGYKDFRVKYNKTNRSLSFGNETETFTAIKLKN